MDRLRIAQEILSFPIINLSHQLSVAAGFLLLGLSRGIEYNVKRTYELTMLVLILAALFSIFKGIDYEEAIFLITVALLLRMSKGQFYRESYVLTWGKTTVDIADYYCDHFDVFGDWIFQFAICKNNHPISIYCHM